VAMDPFAVALVLIPLGPAHAQTAPSPGVCRDLGHECIEGRRRAVGARKY